MDISLTTLTLAAPVVNRQPSWRQKSHGPEYRRAYKLRRKQFQRALGYANGKARGALINTVGVRSRGEVARLMGITKQAVSQLEQSALSKLRRALIPLYRELKN